MDEKISATQDSASQNEKNFDENKNEAFNANLLTNYEVTMEFLKVIEGPGWLEQHKGLEDVETTIGYVMNWLKNANENEHGIILYGWGGIDRYLVHRDGSVKFLSHFATVKTLKRAKDLCFPIEA